MGRTASTGQKLDALTKHQYIWLHQVALCRSSKESVYVNEAIVHMDCSKNYSCKLCTEAQSFHFGGSRKQAIIHACVVYTKAETQSYATISNSLWQDGQSGHPVLGELNKLNPLVSALYFMRDGTITQYINLTNFYVISIILYCFGFKEVNILLVMEDLWSSDRAKLTGSPSMPLWHGSPAGGRVQGSNCCKDT